MIPILYDKSVTNFETNGLGGLPDCLNCEVNEERNGIYELSLTYPITGVNFENLQYDNLIKVKPNRVDGEQIFRIYFVSKPLSGKVVVQAEHISYMLRNIPVRPFSADTAADAVAAIPSYSAVDNPFSFYTDIVSTTGYKIDVPRNCRELLGGSEGSLLDVYHGEYKYDNYNISYLAERGGSSDLTFEYGKNIIDLEQEQNISDLVTAVLPFYRKEAQSEEESDVYIEGDLVKIKVNNVDISANYSYPRIAVLDVSDKFENDIVPTKAQVEKAAEDYIKQNEMYKPKINITVDVVALGDAIGYENMKGIDNVGLCDKVTVTVEKLGVDVTAKIISYTYDVLKERYTELQLGNEKERMSDRVSTSFQALAEQQKSSESFLVESLKNASAYIRGTKNSYMLINRTESGDDSIMFLDNPDKTAAKDVLIINKAGIGFGHNGIYGTFNTAWTNKGEFIADFIKSGTIQSIEINNGNGTFKVDKDGNVTAKSLTATGANINGGNISGGTQTNTVISNGNGTFKVDTNGNMTATGATLKNATIKNGTIDIETSSANVSVIKIKYDKNECVMYPQGFYVSDSAQDSTIIVNAGAISVIKTSTQDTVLQINKKGIVFAKDIAIKKSDGNNFWLSELIPN